MLNLTELDAQDPRHFRVVSWAGKYSGKWVVQRRRDGKVVNESHNLFELLRWVRVWGWMKV
jgi:hypothetical protein